MTVNWVLLIASVGALGTFWILFFGDDMIGKLRSDHPTFRPFIHRNPEKPENLVIEMILPPETVFNLRSTNLTAFHVATGLRCSRNQETDKTTWDGKRDTYPVGWNRDQLSDRIDVEGPYLILAEIHSNRRPYRALFYLDRGWERCRRLRGWKILLCVAKVAWWVRTLVTPRTSPGETGDV